jgi:formaldehyde-activating enzyme
MSKISGVCVGESLVGDGNEVAHVDLLIGPRGSAVAYPGKAPTIEGMIASS